MSGLVTPATPFIDVSAFFFMVISTTAVVGLLAVENITFGNCTFVGTVFLPTQGLHPVDTANLVSSGSTVSPRQ